MTTWAIIAILAFIVLICWCCVAISGQSDDDFDKMMENEKRKRPRKVA